jgi:hypothetical protein
MMKLSQFVLEINLFIFLFIIGISFLVGLLSKRKQLLQLNDKVYDSEKETIKINSELLDQIEINLRLNKEIEQLKGESASHHKLDEKVKNIRLGKIG